MRPCDELWQEFRKTLLGPNSTSASAGVDKPETSLVVIDKIGVVRGFCIIRWRHHPNYGRLLDEPITALEIGPNENEIARAIFDHLVDVSTREASETLRFGRSSAKAWEERAIPDAELCLTGTTMPLGIGSPARPLKRPCRPRPMRLLIANSQSTGYAIDRYRIEQMWAAPQSCG